MVPIQKRKVIMEKTIEGIKAEEFSRKYINKNPDHSRFEGEIIASLTNYYKKNPDGIPTLKVSPVGWFCMVEVL
jgi:hypothetical protein